ncbi:unnamed protein product, partial [Prorocentrum cordatum]
MAADLLDAVSAASNNDIGLLIDLADGETRGKGSTEGEHARPRAPKRRKVVLSAAAEGAGATAVFCIGVVGPLPSECEELFGAASQKMMLKSCHTCNAEMGSPDPLDPNRCRAWDKPDFQGCVCAHCGCAKKKLHPTKAISQVNALLSECKAEYDRFHQWITDVIAHYKAGHKTLKNLCAAPRETLDQVKETGVKGLVKGKAKLLESYVADHGDPLANGLGHKKTRQKWKDGSMRDVVIIPTTPDDEMDMEWYTSSGFAYKKEIHDGEGVDGDNVVGGIYADVQNNQARNQIVGVAQPVAPPVEPTSVPKMASTTVGAAGGGGGGDDDGGGESSAAEPDDDMGLDIFDVIMDDAASTASRGTQRSAEAAAGGARAKGNKAKAKAKASCGGLPSLSGSGSGGASSGRAGAARRGTSAVVVDGGPPDRAESDAKRQASKLRDSHEEICRSQRAHIWSLDKKHFKAVKSITDSLSAKVRLLRKRELQNEVAAVLKLTEMSGRVVKCYKQWVKKADNAEFMDEYADIQKFSNEHPVVQLDAPLCVEQGIVEASFIMGIVEEAVAGNVSGMMARWGLISMTKCRRLFKSDEMADFQRERIGDALLGLVSHRDAKAPKDVAAHVSWVQCFLLVSVESFAFDLHKGVGDLIQLLRVVFNVKGYGGNLAQANDALLELGRGADEIAKAITATGAGTRMLKYLKEVAAEIGDREQSAARVTALLQAGATSITIEAIVRLDAELAATGFEDEAHLQSFRELFISNVSKISDLVNDLVNGELSGDGNRPPQAHLENNIRLPLTALMSTSYMLHKGDGTMEKVILASMLDVCNSPIRNIASGAVSTSDVAVLEEVAVAIASAGKLMETAVQEFCRQKSIKVEGCIAFGMKGRDLLSKHEGACVGPKMQEIMELIMLGQLLASQDLFDNPGREELVFMPGDGAFLEAVAKLAAEQTRVKAKLVSVAPVVEEVATLLNALGKTPLATAVTIFWQLFSVRMAFARHAQVAADADLGIVGHVEGDFASTWFTLCNAVSKLSTAQGCISAQSGFNFDSFHDGLAIYGMPRVAHCQMVKEVQGAIEASKMLVAKSVGALAASAQRVAEGLLSKITKYEEYVVTKWDGETVKKELVDVPWDSFAEARVQLSKLLNAAATFDHAVAGGGFKSKYDSAAATAGRALSSGRTFIGVISFSKMVLVTIPGAAAKDRLGLLEGLQKKSAGANLPKQLVEYMGREIQKMKGGGKATRGAAQ